MITKLEDKACNCPNCGKNLNAATGVTDNESSPRKDDLTVCYYCAEILLYGEDLQLIKCPKEVIDDLPKETVCDLKRAQIIVLSARN